MNGNGLKLIREAVLLCLCLWSADKGITAQSTNSNFSIEITTSSQLSTSGVTIATSSQLSTSGVIITTSSQLSTSDVIIATSSQLSTSDVIIITSLPLLRMSEITTASGLVTMTTPNGTPADSGAAANQCQNGIYIAVIIVLLIIIATLVLALTAVIGMSIYWRQKGDLQTKEVMVGYNNEYEVTRIVNTQEITTDSCEAYGVTQNTTFKL